MKRLILLLLIFEIVKANALTDVANKHLKITKKDLYYESFNRYSIQQFTRALKLYYYDKKKEVYKTSKIKEVMQNDI